VAVFVTLLTLLYALGPHVVRAKHRMVALPYTKLC